MTLHKKNHKDFYLLWLCSGFSSSSTICMKAEVRDRKVKVCDLHLEISTFKLQLDLRLQKISCIVFANSVSELLYLQIPSVVTIVTSKLFSTL